MVDYSLFYNAKAQLILWVLLGTAALATLFFTLLDPTGFSTFFAAEDGPIEYGTALLLFFACLALLALAFGVRGLPRILLIIYALAFFFAAGEEISWGQRIFGVESSEFFKQNNYQGETNLHNLVIGDVHLVEHIFGRGLALVLLCYLVLLPLLYPFARWVRVFCDKLAVPVPPRHVAVIALLASILVGWINLARSWEVYEFVFANLACMIFLAPVNRQTFRR